MRLTGFLIISFIAGCATPSRELHLGGRYSLRNSHGSLMVASAQTWPYEDAVIDGISYSIAVNDSSKIAYIGTNDPKFRTPEGLSTTSTLGDVLKAGGKPVIYELGWAHYSELPSGWCAAFYGPMPDILKPPTYNSHVAHYFKRR